MRNFQGDVSVCGVAAWLLELDLHDLHLAQLRAAAAPEEAAKEPGGVQARICNFLLKHRDVLESRVVLEMIAQHPAPSLLLYALELYNMHVQAFHLAVTGSFTASRLHLHARSRVPCVSLEIKQRELNGPMCLDQAHGAGNRDVLHSKCRVLGPGLAVVTPHLLCRKSAESYASPRDHT